MSNVEMSNEYPRFRAVVAQPVTVPKQLDYRTTASVRRLMDETGKPPSDDGFFVDVVRQVYYTPAGLNITTVRTHAFRNLVALVLNEAAYAHRLDRDPNAIDDAAANRAELETMTHEEVVAVTNRIPRQGMGHVLARIGNLLPDDEKAWWLWVLEKTMAMNATCTLAAA